ncbi:hypothetical protein DFJ58DRAFT_913214 [Suillus subalutaceus]|uniref:uncharacterized protein n=1 Tax=Suillus subalutaceus TaxID=48586 RepID=UPI001B87B847|nr:uncharacterized protein DFJ58DRAFT_913214 [Suillus subalutaceus]KAG1858986.1 hypothetical protein DFJ58DRAFT_913214 [Suillus subalutaceus]
MFYWRKNAYNGLRAYDARMRIITLAHTVRTLQNTSDGPYKVERPAAFAAYLPTDGVCGFHITKSTLASNFSMANGFWGIESTSDPGTYASWSIDLRPPPPMLIVTRLCASEEMFPGLIAKIRPGG